MALNGTSSVLYGTVPELVTPERRQRAFSIFYTGGVGAGALAPVLYGLISDFADVPTMMLLVAAVVLVTLPLAWRLGPYLNATPAGLTGMTVITASGGVLLSCRNRLDSNSPRFSSTA